MPERKESKPESTQEREVVRCKVCGLVQYRTRTDHCRRCLRVLPPPVEFLLPPPSAGELPGDDRQLFESWPNQDTVENIGLRIRQLRESRGMTQSQLQARSRVSRSYLSRIESGQMTPSLGTLEKISEALGVGLSRFFVPESQGESLMEDPFIQGVRPFLRQLNSEQWEWILKRLQAITTNVTSRAVQPGYSAPARPYAIVAARPAVPAAAQPVRAEAQRKVTSLPAAAAPRNGAPGGGREHANGRSRRAGAPAAHIPGRLGPASSWGVHHNR